MGFVQRLLVLQSLKKDHHARLKQILKQIRKRMNNNNKMNSLLDETQKEILVPVF